MEWRMKSLSKPKHSPDKVWPILESLTLGELAIIYTAQCISDQCALDIMIVSNEV